MPFNSKSDSKCVSKTCRAGQTSAAQTALGFVVPATVSGGGRAAFVAFVSGIAVAMMWLR